MARNPEMMNFVTDKPSHARKIVAPVYPDIVPNAVTIAAMEEPDDKLASFATFEEEMAWLHADC